MDDAVRDCLVEGYEDLIDSLNLPDPDDRHVLAAAVRAGADTIITFNLKDFPTDVLKPHGVQAIHPDQFLESLFEAFPSMVIEIVRLQRDGLRNPPRSAEQLLTTFAANGLTHFSNRLRLSIDML